MGNIKGISFNLPHTELISEEHPIFEAVSSFYKRHEEIEADKKELLQESRDIIRSNPGRLASEWWGWPSLPSWIAKAGLMAPMAIAILVGCCCAAKLGNLILRCI